MSKRQADDKKLAGALICCLILGTSMVSVIAFYSSILNTNQNTINSLNSDIAERDAQISSLNSEMETMQSQIANLTFEKETLESQILNLTEIIELSKTESWIDEYFDNVTAGTYISWNRTIDYAGYIKFDKFGGGSTNGTGEIYAQVIWASNNRVYFDEKKILGKDSIFRFPVLPTSNLEVRVGFDDPENGTANIIVAVSYVY
jgi:cell division protein FtsL